MGFEPTVRSHVRRFSRPLQSTALALLQRYSIGYSLILHKTKFIVKRVDGIFYFQLILIYNYLKDIYGRIYLLPYSLLSKKEFGEKKCLIILED